MWCWKGPSEAGATVINMKQMLGDILKRVVDPVPSSSSNGEKKKKPDVSFKCNPVKVVMNNPDYTLASRKLTSCSFFSDGSQSPFKYENNNDMNN